MTTRPMTLGEAAAAAVQLETHRAERAEARVKVLEEQSLHDSAHIVMLKKQLDIAKRALGVYAGPFENGWESTAGRAFKDIDAVKLDQ